MCSIQNYKSELWQGELKGKNLRDVLIELTSFSFHKHPWA